MKKYYLLCVLTLMFSISIHAQSPSITITNPEKACLNSVQKIQVSITGTFNANNKFAVQIRKGNNMPVVSEIPAELVDGKIQVTHTDSSLSVFPYIQARIVTTSPKVESDWHNVQINVRGSVNLAVAESDTINAGEDLILSFTAFSSSDVRITLNDSSTYTLYSFSAGNFGEYRRKGVSVNTPFYIVHAENVCGAMAVSGQAKATINPTSLRTLSVLPASVCEDSEIKVRFSTSGSALPANTKYRLRIVVYNDLGNRKTVEVPAQLKDNMLVSTFPKSFNLTGRSVYKVRIITENPSITGTDTDYSFVVYPKANAVFNTPAKTINLGEKVTLGITFSGSTPFAATLQDGTTISGGINSQVELRPDKTTAYTVKSMNSGCVTEALPPTSTMLVTVRPGIFLDQVEDRKILCAGTLAKVKILSNVEFNANSTFMVNAVIANKTVYSFPAKKVGDYLEFEIPTLPKNADRLLSYDNISVMYISTTSPEYRSVNSTAYVIQSVPDMAVLPHSVLNYKVPSQALFAYELQGKGPFTIEDAAGISYNIEGYETWYPDFYLNKTMDFRLKSISNSCFKNETLPTVHLALDTVRAAPGIHIQPLKSLICRQDSLEITFMKTGTFQPGNVFNIEGYIDCCTYKVLATVNKDGTFKVKVPVSQGQSGFVNFRISSTNPVLYSDYFQSQMQVRPDNFTINPSGTAESPIEYLRGAMNLSLSNNGGGTLSSFVYSDGVTEKTQELKPSEYSALVTPPLGTTTAYTIKSATNQCGTVPVNLTTYIRVIPYRILIMGSEGGLSLGACEKGNFSVSFVTTDGDATKSNFTLQIAKDKSKEFTDLMKNVTSRVFEFPVPDNLTQGTYQLRILSSEGGISNVVNLVIGALPSAVMTTAAKDPIILNPGQGIASTITLTGSPYWTVIYENSQKETTDRSPYTRDLSSDSQKEFSLITVYNSCGYGPVSGKISVKVSPVLNIYSDIQEVCLGKSIAVRYLLRGDAPLANDYIRFQLVDTQSQKVQNLDSTRNIGGSILLKLPETLPGNFYELRCTLKSYNLSSVLSLNIKSKVDVSISGNTIINAGENAQLLIKSNKPVNEGIQYTLSDGQSGIFYGGTGSRESFIKVNPTKTTTYTLVSAGNVCSEGKKSGSAVVEVNPAGERTVSVPGWEPFGGSAFCLGDAILVNYTQKGSFSSGNVMTVQISDTTGQNFRSLNTIGNTSPLKASIPGDLFVGKKYRIRVVASDPGTGSGAYEYLLTPGSKASARFASESIIYDNSNIPKLVVLLDGTGAWQYDYGTDLNVQSRYSTSQIDTIYLQKNSLGDYYKLFRVSNQCGAGTIGTPNVARVQVITGETMPYFQQVTVAPNPTEDLLIVKFPNASLRTLNLLNAAGILMLKKSSSLEEEQIKISQLPAGIYILSIEGKNSESTHKIIKR